MKRQIEEGLRLGSLHPLAADLDVIHAAADAKRAEIESGNKYAPAYKQSLIAAVAADTTALVEKAKAEHLKASIRPLDTEEGQLRAALRTAVNDPWAGAREARAARFVGLMGNARDADTVDSIWRDALLADDSDAIAAAASAGLKKHADLAAAAKRVPSQRDAAISRSMVFEAAVAEWARAHPSPARRLAMIERERHNVAVAIEETVAFCARLYGAGSRSRVAPGFHEGRGLDRRTKAEAVDVPASERMLAGMNRTSVRR